MEREGFGHSPQPGAEAELAVQDRKKTSSHEPLPLIDGDGIIFQKGDARLQIDGCTLVVVGILTAATTIVACANLQKIVETLVQNR